MSALDDATRLARQVAPTPPRASVREQNDPRNEAGFKQLLRETRDALRASGVPQTSTWLRIAGGWDETVELRPATPAWPLRVFALDDTGTAWPYLAAVYQPKMLDRRSDYPGFGPGSKGLWLDQGGPLASSPNGISFRDICSYDDRGTPYYRPPTSGWGSYEIRDGFLERMASHPHWDGARLPLVDAIALGLSEL